MTTLKVSDGDLFINDYGRIEYITEMEEASQNVARAILTNYDSFFDEGNELLNFASGGSSAPFLNEMLIQQFLTESINRLIIKQRDIEISGKILQVNQIKTRIVGMTTLVFLVEVMFVDGTINNIVGQAKIKPTKLDHIVNPSSLINV